MIPATLKLKIISGTTMRYQVQLQQPFFEYRPIAGMLSAAPVRLTVPSHGLPGDWTVWCEGVPNWPDLNQDKLRTVGRQARVIDDNTIEFNELTGVGRTAVAGFLVYRLPIDLTGMQVRVEIRGVSAEPIVLTQPNGGVVVEGPGQVLLVLSVGVVDGITGANGEWDMDLTYADGSVARWLHGPVVVSEGGGCANGC